MSNLTKKQLSKERADTVVALRELCRVFGDNDWDDDLNLSDAIEKHLAKPLYTNLDTLIKKADTLMAAFNA